MITVNKPLNHSVISIEATCDLCGCQCNQYGARHERLYEYNGDQLCYECLWDAMTGDGTVTLPDIE